MRRAERGGGQQQRNLVLTSTSHSLLSSSLPSSSSGTTIKGDVAAVRGTTLAGLRWRGRDPGENQHNNQMGINSTPLDDAKERSTHVLTSPLFGGLKATECHHPPPARALTTPGVAVRGGNVRNWLVVVDVFRGEGVSVRQPGKWETSKKQPIEREGSLLVKQPFAVHHFNNNHRRSQCLLGGRGGREGGGRERETPKCRCSRGLWSGTGFTPIKNTQHDTGTAESEDEKSELTKNGTCIMVYMQRQGMRNASESTRSACKS